VRVDRYIPADPGQGVPGQYLWSRYFEYAPPITLLSPSSERHVTYTYAPRVETHLYRPEQVASPGSSFVPLAGGDPIERSPVQAGSKTIEQRSLVDTNGTVLEQRDSRDAAEGDRLRVTQFSDNAFGEALAITCDQSWRCLPRHVTMASDVGSLVPLRRTRLTYDVTTADVTLIEGFLEENHGLVRFHEAGDWVHNAAPNQATAGWKWLGHFDYTPRGFVALATGPGAPDTPSRACTRFVPDDIYGHFPKTILNFKDGCDSASRLETNLTFDRGFGVPVATTAPDLGVSLVMLDAFGRPQDVFEPGPDLPSPALEKTAHFEYGDRSAVSYVDVVRYTAPGGSEAIRSVQLMNGLLEPVLRFDQGDAEAWIASGWTLRDNAGRAYLTHRPFAVSPGVNPTAVGGPSVSPPGTGVFVSSMDGFGRQYSVTENGTQIFARSFEPLAVVSRDAEQVGAGAHVGAYTRVEHTTRGQVRRIKTHAAGGADVTTVSTYDGADKLSTVTRTSSAGGLYTRRVSWDSLGRLVKNWEPNTTSPATTWGWVYAWNDANRLAGTSDARGCGKDFHYDSLGRVVGEDYTPCLASQAPYSRADPATGADFEVVNRYDDYEPGQVAPDATFADNAVLATGRLVSTRDRGAVTRYSYDNRGRVRRVARQVAKPLSQQGAGVEPYTPHWYKQRSDFDNAGRLTWRSSGADEGPFADGPGTAESYGYSARGLLQAVSSAQHGLIIDKISYEVDGQVDQIRYGDVAHTTADPHYDSRRRMDGYKVERAAPALWTTPSAQYSLPTTDTTQTILADFTYGYDLVGNPLTIEDHASAADWRDYAWPQRMRSMGYDDLYRVTSVTYGYGTPSGAGSFRSPFAPETNAGDRSPVPLQTQLATRVQNETFTYDFLGNIASSTDDQNAAYDRSLGVVTHGDGAGARPNQLTAANGVQARYDASGNLVELKVERAGTCATGPAGSKCAQWFAYDWNEVGELARARRWDYTSSLPTLGAGATVPPETPEWDLNYAYSGGARVVKSATDSFGSRHTLEIFDTLRLDHDEFLTAQGDYKRDRRQTHVYLAGGVGHVFYDGDGSLPAPPTTQPTRLFLNIGDHLGSASLTIDHTSSELVERATFHSHGAIESDYRTNRWDNAREPYKFTGKEEDIEVGATYFGARYYNAHLGRFLSADPLTIHGLAGDLNPYAYVRGRVMSHVDPFGLEDKPAAGPAQQPYPQPQPGTVQQGPRTTVETSGSGSPPPPTHAEIIAARTADTFARIEGAHIPTGGGTYIAVGDVHRETVNAVATAPVNLLASLLDPSGIMRIVAATSGHPVAPRVIAASTDPKNVSSNAVGLALGIAGVAGARSLAAEGGGGASSSSFVYQLVDGAGEPVYFGLTNNPAVRVAQHGRMPPGPFSGMQVISDPLPLPQAQALETSLIGQAHAEGTFIYNLSPTSISPTAPVAVPPTIFPSLTLLNPKIYKPR
jgi:RHS repeat-associated protein